MNVKSSFIPYLDRKDGRTRAARGGIVARARKEELNDTKGQPA